MKITTHYYSIFTARKRLFLTPSKGCDATTARHLSKETGIPRSEFRELNTKGHETRTGAVKAVKSTLYKKYKGIPIECISLY